MVAAPGQTSSTKRKWKLFGDFLSADFWQKFRVKLVNFNPLKILNMDVCMCECLWYDLKAFVSFSNIF